MALKTSYPQNDLSSSSSRLLQENLEYFEKNATLDYKSKIQIIFEESKAVLIIKIYFCDRSEINQQYRENSNMDTFGIFLLLRYIEALITDYSSVYFDFLLLNRPIIFAPFDFEDYIRKDREFYDNYNDVTPGPKAKNWDEVLEYIKEAIQYPKKYESERKRICKLFNAYNDANNSERVYEAIKEMLNE